MITFDVSPVEASQSPLARIDLSTSFEKRAKSPVEACAANMASVVSIPRVTEVGLEEGRFGYVQEFGAPQSMSEDSRHAWVRAPHPGFAVWNGFMATLSVAFDGHYPLTLSPDDIWLCIAQGFATHVNHHAEALRKRFVPHEHRVTLRVTRDDFVKGSPANPWPEVVSDFSDQLAAYIGKKRELMVADFSTTGLIERTATEIALMDAMHSYFHYRVRGLCGIPRITLRGTVSDWRAIRTRVENLVEYQLDDWAAMLLPVIDQMVMTAAGTPNVEFWRSIYRSSDMSGGPRLIDGWCNALFPYLHFRGRVVRNGYLDSLRCARRDRGDAWWIEDHGVDDDEDAEGAAPDMPPFLEEFPSGLSSVPFTWEIGDEETPMELLGGFAGVTQHDDLSVQPAIGWAVREWPSSTVP